VSVVGHIADVAAFGSPLGEDLGALFERDLGVVFADAEHMRSRAADKFAMKAPCHDAKLGRLGDEHNICSRHTQPPRRATTTRPSACGSLIEVIAFESVGFLNSLTVRDNSRQLAVRA
jgi:hypothetical protein